MEEENKLTILPAGEFTKSEKTETPENEVETTTEEKKEVVKQETEFINPVTSTETTEEPTQNKTQEILKAAVADLVQEGIFSQEDVESFDGTIEGWKTLQNKRIEQEANKRHESWIEELDPTAKTYLGLIEDGVSSEAALVSQKNLNYYENLDKEALKGDSEDAAKVRRFIIERDFLTRGFSEQEARELTDDIVDLNKDVTKVESALNSLVKQEKYIIKNETDRINQTKQELEETRKKEFEDLKSRITDMKELYPGLSATEQHKKMILEAYTEVAGKDKNGKELNSVQLNRSKAPTEWERAITVLSVLGILDIDDKGKWNPDFNKIKNDVTTQVSSNLETVLGKGFSNGSGTSAKTLEEGEGGDIIAALRKAEKQGLI